ncbi:MAG: AarF/UbiB family protein [Candidatus Faecimonas sp.]|nr:AarF/UbiB family protein [Mycoplasmatota bacterium]MDY2908042.1 AarF/UbiB family protein [Candidatus Faecimonas sp.]
MKNSPSRLSEIIAVIKKYRLTKDITPENVRLALEELGPTFVKMGQILSSRDDLIPKEFCNEFQKLKHSVKPMPYETVEEILTREYDCPPSEIYQEINKIPVGSASIAQVHKAVLKTGEVVAIKVRRENIEELMERDARLLKKVISLLHLNKIFGDIINLTQVIDEMYDRAKEEMNFHTEKKHIEEFRENNKELVYLKPLKVFNKYSTNNILVMEYIDGFNISDTEELKKAGYDMDEIAEKLAHNYLKQAIDDGFYHADPHSDNIKVVEGKIAYLDFGMMGRLSKRNRNLLEKCIIAIVKNDINEVAHILTLLDTSNNTPDYMQLKNDIRKVLDKNKTTEIINIDIKEFVTEMFILLRQNEITLPKEITMLIRGIVVLEGTLEKISPNINLINVLEKKVEPQDVLLDKEKVSSFALSTVKSGANLLLLPSEALTTLKGINNGELRFNIELTDSKHQIDRIEKIVHLVIVSALDVAFIIGTSQIVKAENTLPFIFYLYLFGAIICTLWLLYKLIISKFKKL